MRMRQVLAPTVAIAALLAGCTGDDDPNSAVTTAATGVDASTTRPRASAPTSVSLTTTTSTSTTAAVTTTTTVPIEQQVRAAMLGYYDFYWRCLRAPEQCDPAQVTVPDSDAFNALTNTKNDLVKGHLFVGSEDVGYMVITAIEPKDDHTLVTTCWWSTAVLYLQPPVEGAPATVQNNTPSSGYETFQFVQQPDLTWRVRRSDLVGEDSTENVCPAKS